MSLQSIALTSPALSTASASSYDLLSMSITSHASDLSSFVQDDGSDDEIVWSVSAGSSLSSSISDLTESSGSDTSDDFVVLSRPGSPSIAPNTLSAPSNDKQAPSPSHPLLATSTSDLSAKLQKLSLDDSQAKPPRSNKAVRTVTSAAAEKTSQDRRKRKAVKRAARKVAAAANAPPTLTPVVKSASTVTLTPSAISSPPSPTLSSSSSSSKKSKKQKKKQKKAVAAGASTTGLGARPVLEENSDALSVEDSDGDVNVSPPSMYEEAVGYISSFLSNPDAKQDSVCRLTLLQSLIVELGIATSSLPASLTAAKALLKSHAFLNIREYLATRGQGPDAMQKLMYPSRSALIKDIRKKGNPASLKWVKDHGLQVLLVSCFR
ncbi:hypothetical protein BDQ12DRAFT_300801 [Crucibulum laeve]|uniref:Uncharacterized protein n=1 Tax=Crucibulum laeve TaxID=68775 RepID=A0A5C3ME71_9AGAR|nr:hypothetical protein BDQ12DRAFT_300801 [Crucibulum laeve]